MAPTHNFNGDMGEIAAPWHTKTSRAEEKQFDSARGHSFEVDRPGGLSYLIA
jgi:hypothetical protein